MVDRHVILGSGFHARLAVAVKKGSVKPLALGLALGVSESAVSRWKHGGNISLEHVARLCSFLGVSADWLLLNRHPVPPESGGQISVRWADTP